MRRQDLRVWKEGPPSGNAWLAEVSDAEFAELVESMGYVRRPVCGECEGTGEDASDEATAGGTEAPWDCPSCGGTGFGRLVALDGIDVETVRLAMNPVTAARKYQDEANAARLAVCKAVLAALEEEDTP